MFANADFDADLSRYPRRPFLREQSIWAIFIYRYGRRVLKRRRGILRTIELKLYWLMFRIIETITGISLPLEARIGPGLRIFHFGNIFIHSESVIGRNCTLRHGVTIGNRTPDGPAPVIGDDVDFGAYAQVLGNVHIGDGAKIGAMSVVLSDVPAGATAFGIPARVIPGGVTPAQGETASSDGAS
jgi:serine O-acetyltransferase